MIQRPARLEDAPALARLGRETFCASFGHLYKEDDLNAFLEDVFSPAAVKGEIAGQDCIHRLVEDNAQLIAYCKMMPVAADYAALSRATDPILLGQLYTLPERIGEGIGATLMEWAIGEAREGGHDAILLSVWSENFGAQRFYQRYGFVKIADIDFWVGDHRDDEFLYELRLT